jgi:hypothetical protein
MSHHGHSHGDNGECQQVRRRRGPPPNPDKDKEFATEAFRRLDDVQRNIAKPEPSPRCEFWLVLSDPCGLVCAILTHFVIQFVNYVTVFKVILPWLMTKESYRIAFFHICVFETFIFFMTWSHFKCMLSDPGTLTHLWGTKSMEKIKVHMESYLLSRADGTHGMVSRPWCAKCDNYKPAHTHHCSYCGTCIEGFDHHCPWMNNCVGKRNHKFFMLFLLYVGSGSAYAIVLTVYRMWSCMKVSPMMARHMAVSWWYFMVVCFMVVFFMFVFFVATECDSLNRTWISSLLFHCSAAWMYPPL